MDDNNPKIEQTTVAALPTSNNTQNYWSAGIFSIRKANDVLKSASQIPTPRELWGKFWYEGEVCCLFSDSNAGKSILAVQIADNIAKQGDMVIYCDFELSDIQFYSRYTEGNQIYEFPANFLRAEISSFALAEKSKERRISFDDLIKASIEDTVKMTNAKILIIDNLTYMCINSEKGDAAGELMIMLKNLQREYNLSMLILSHTPKRNMYCPITQNDLAGSKRQFNFFDSCFAIGVSAKDESLRYIKQLKVRYGQFTYASDNVVVCQIDKIGCKTQFVRLGFASEREHLKERTQNDTERMETEAIKLIDQGFSLREVGDKIGMSKSWVDKIVKKKRQK